MISRKDGMHLYVHIPFCHRICPYCSFHKHTPGGTNMRNFVNALLREAELKQKIYTIRPTTLYFGGGTPSMLSDRHLKTLVDGLKSIFDLSTLDEFTFETNPATFNAKRAVFFRELGITRVSLGAQSWDPAILKTLGREHTPEQIRSSVLLLDEVGMPDINIDLMFSIPEQSLASWQNTLEQTLSLPIHHISAYNLNYEEDTDFFKRLGADEHWMIDPDGDAEFFDLTDTLLTQAGFRHYETSNFALPDHLSLHNMGYWAGHDYMGLGPGAVSTLRGARLSNHAHTPAYISHLISQTNTPQSITNKSSTHRPLTPHASKPASPSTDLPPHSVEAITPDMFRLERIALMLRTDTGLPSSYIENKSNAFIQNIINEGMALYKNENLVLINQGRLLVDEIAAQLC